LSTATQNARTATHTISKRLKNDTLISAKDILPHRPRDLNPHMQANYRCK
jgi:hypothetical protein